MVTMVGGPDGAAKGNCPMAGDRGALLGPGQAGVALMAGGDGRSRSHGREAKQN